MSPPQPNPQPATAPLRSVTRVSRAAFAAASAAAPSPKTRDPSTEIHAMLDQLKQSASDARAALATAEQEKSELTRQLEHALQTVEHLRAGERDLRSKFIEVTALMQAREAAQQLADRQTAALREAEKKIESIERERAEESRQHDATTRKLQVQAQSARELTEQTSEAQKQAVAIRQARDAAHAQNLELVKKLSAAEDEIAELGYQRSDVQKAGKATAAELAEARREADAAANGKDALIAQVQQLTRELDEQRKRRLDLAEEKSAEVQEDAHAAALEEARQQVAELTREREAARTQAAESARALESFREQAQTRHASQTEEADDELATAREKQSALEAQLREARLEARTAREILDEVRGQLSCTQGEAAQAGTRLAELEMLPGELADVRESLAAAQRQFAQLAGEYDALTEKVAEHACARDAHLAAAGFAQEGAAQKAAELRESRTRLDQQRMETIEVGAQLQTAQREIRELSASLAEARLQVKFANAARPPAEASTVSAPQNAAAPEPPLTEKESRSTLAGMRTCVQAFAKTPFDLSLLNELHCQLYSFSERARVTGFVALHRVGSALADLTHALYEVPAQITAQTLGTLGNSLEFLGTMVKERHLLQGVDPLTALVYLAASGDETTESIALAMEASMLRVRCAPDPGTALTELAESCYDLVFVGSDFAAPDGADFCGEIRRLPLHARTPILLLTSGDAAPSMGSATDTLAQPFHFHELTVKALVMIVKSRLEFT